MAKKPDKVVIKHLSVHELILRDKDTYFQTKVLPLSLIII